MPHFVNHTHRYYISTSYKVLYTLFVRQPLLAIAGRKPMVRNAFVKWLTPLPGWGHFLLVRNPYDRLVSFYKDKFQQEPYHHACTYAELQICQKLFADYAGIAAHDSPREVSQKLRGFSFARFIHYLPEVYLRDGHLVPQAQLRTLSFYGLPVCPLKFDRVLKLECAEDRAYLQHALALDLTRKVNSTHTIQLANPWSLPLRAIVNQLYRADFTAFGYQRCEQ